MPSHFRLSPVTSEIRLKSNIATKNCQVGLNCLYQIGVVNKNKANGRKNDTISPENVNYGLP
jgi:hypothetical protein